MENGTHTQGQWLVQRGANGFGDVGIYSDSELAFELATVHNGGSDRATEANARLIAAAPDLLAACKALLKRVEHLPYEGPEFTDARDAIARAEGRVL